MHRHMIFTDVHGEAWALKAALKNAQYDPEDCTIVSLGDAIDRGRYSKNVMDILLAPEKHPSILLAGNHEALLLEAMSGTGNIHALNSWFTGGFGAQATLRSYGFDYTTRLVTAGDGVIWEGKSVKTAADVRALLLEIFGEKHLKAIEDSIYSWILKNPFDGVDFFCCHGGGVVGRRMDSLEDWLLCWGDRAYDEGDWTHPERVIVVYGHFHHPRPWIGRKKLNLALSGEVAILVCEPDHNRIVTSEGEEIFLDVRMFKI